jgi:hypothetical protein
LIAVLSGDGYSTCDCQFFLYDFIQDRYPYCAGNVTTGKNKPEFFTS